MDRPDVSIPPTFWYELRVPLNLGADGIILRDSFALEGWTNSPNSKGFSTLISPTPSLWRSLERWTLTAWMACNTATLVVPPEPRRRHSWSGDVERSRECRHAFARRRCDGGLLVNTLAQPFSDTKA